MSRAKTVPSAKYVLPRIRIYGSLDDLLKEWKEMSRLVSFFREEDLIKDVSDFLTNGKTIVIGEPGFGKSRLLFEVQKKSKELGKTAFLLNLKNVKQNFRKELKGIRNSEEMVVCLDGLDEVSYEDFSEVVDAIKDFSRRYPKVNLLVSCRLHFFIKHQVLFIEENFKYANIFEFSQSNIISFLTERGIDHRTIDKILNTFYLGRELIIQVPRYLEYFVKFFEENANVDIELITRHQLFAYFINGALLAEDKKADKNVAHLKEEFLSKLALVMEIAQTNVITKDELMIFLDSIDSDIKLILLHEIKVHELYNNTLLIEKGDTLEFQNVEFQEYLAAKELLKFSNPSRTIFDFAIEPELKEIVPTWYNTLTFVVDLNRELLDPIYSVTLSKVIEGIGDPSYLHFITRVDPRMLSLEQRKEIFSKVYGYYQRVLNWMDYQIAENLAYYFDESFEKHLKLTVGLKVADFPSAEARYIQMGNIALIVGYLFKVSDGKIDKEFWKKQLIKWANMNNTHQVLQRHALIALTFLNDPTVIPLLSTAIKSKEEHVRDGVLRLATEIDPNQESSLEYFLEGTKAETLYARYGLLEVTDKSLLKKFINALVKDEILLRSFLSKSSLFKDRDAQIIQHLDTVFDDKIKKLCLSLLKQILGKHHENTVFVEELVSVMKKRDRKFIFEFLSIIKSSQHPLHFFYESMRLLASLLEKGFVEEFIKISKEITSNENGAISVLFAAKSMGKMDVFEEGRKYLGKQYKRVESEGKRPKKKSNSIAIYEEFVLKLEPVPNHYSTDIFHFYLDNRNELDKVMTDKDKKRLEEIVLIFLNGKFNPINQKLTITRQSEGGMSWTTSQGISMFGGCIRVARENPFFRVDISPFREKLINFIPFADHQELEIIFSTVKVVSDSEIKKVMKIYSDKLDDRSRFRPENFIRAVKKYGITAAEELVMGFVKNDKMSAYTKMLGIESLDSIWNGANMLKALLASTELKKKDNYSLQEKANEILILRYSDKEAVKWRMTEIVNRVSPSRRASGVRSGSDETLTKDFAKPLMQLSDPALEKEFFDLLKESFKIFRRGENFHDYAYYIWSICTAYLENRKQFKNYEPIQKLERYVSENVSTIGVNWFLHRVHDLKRSYMEFISSHKSISMSVQKFNEAKTKKALTISDQEQLFEVIRSIVERDMVRWVQSEGAYDFLMLKTEITRPAKGKKGPKYGYEHLIQKTLKTQFENGLLKKGFVDADITREPELLQGKKVDFLITYGFAGSVLIETKLMKHPDLSAQKKNLKKKSSYSSMETYMKGYNRVKKGIFLIFDNSPRRNDKKRKEIQEVYEKIEGVKVLFLDCQKGASKNI